MTPQKGTTFGPLGSNVAARAIGIVPLVALHGFTPAESLTEKEAVGRCIHLHVCGHNTYTHLFS